MPVMELLGAALGPHYTIERELTGGMSRVVVAHDRLLDRRVVVKLLPPDLAATVSLERFRREILVVAGLQHPNIVPVLAAGEVRDADPGRGEALRLPYLVMPFVEGESLRLRVARGPLRVVETVGILRDVARALAYAHERGIVHRDIKPDNVLLSSGAAVVADFGVAKALSSARRDGGSTAHRGTITAAGTTLGTPDYMAPEQIAADPAADHRVDLYALGAMGYEMLAGVPPFHDRTPQALLAAHLTEAPRPLPEHRADLPAALCRLVMRCLEKDPAKRPQSATAVLEALEDPSVVSGAFATPMSLPTGTMPAAARSMATSRRRLLVGAAAGVALLAAGVVGTRQLATSDDGARPAAVATAPAAPARPSLAVLPLTYLGADSGFAYVAQGITSELTSAAGRVAGLRVLSQGAAEQLRQRLVRGDSTTGGVTMFLEGVVQREGDQLRVDARIVSTSDGFMLWANSYEGTVAERFQLQRALGEAVAAALAEHLAPGDST